MPLATSKSIIKHNFPNKKRVILSKIMRKTNYNNRRIPSLNALRAFEIAARHGNFAKAAEELHVTPAAVSHLIKGLEEYLEITLFDRVGRRVIVSTQGQRILPELQQGFALIEGALTKIANEHQILTISAHPAFSAKWLLPRIHHFNTLYPEIDVRIDTSHTPIDLRSGGIDAAIRFGEGNYPGMITLPLLSPYKEEIFPVCSPKLLSGKHPLTTPNMLRFHTLLHDENNSEQPLVPGWKRWLKMTGITKIDTRRGLRFTNPLLTLEAALSGQGVALSCAYVTADDVKAGRLVRPFAIPCPLNATYHFVYPKENKNPRIEKFYHWLQETCMADLKSHKRCK